MTKWERSVYKKIGKTTPADAAALKKELQSIFDENLTTKGKSPARFGVRLTSGLTAGDPPEFDQEVIVVKDGPKPGVFHVVTKHRKMSNTLWRYVVVDSDGLMAIDDRQTRVLSKDESQKVASGQGNKLPEGKWQKLGY
jgi:hypothetical protein